MKFLGFYQFKGSNLFSSAHWEGGARTSFQNVAAKNFASPSEGAAEGGCGGNSAAPEPKRSPAALLVQSRTPKKSFVFLLEEKMGRAQKENRKQNFSLVERALASGGGAVQSVFRSKKVRAKDIISPPIETSAFERVAPRGRVAAALRKIPRRFAAKRLGGLNSKRADLFVSYLKPL